MKNNTGPGATTNRPPARTLGKSVLINNFCQCPRQRGYVRPVPRRLQHDRRQDLRLQQPGQYRCLICHESTGTVLQDAADRGNQAYEVMFTDKPAIDLTKVAQA